MADITMPSVIMIWIMPSSACSYSWTFIDPSIFIAPTIIVIATAAPTIDTAALLPYLAIAPTAVIIANTAPSIAIASSDFSIRYGRLDISPSSCNGEISSLKAAAIRTAPTPALAAYLPAMAAAKDNAVIAPRTITNLSRFSSIVVQLIPESATFCSSFSITRIDATMPIIPRPLENLTPLAATDNAISMPITTINADMESSMPSMLKSLILPRAVRRRLMEAE